MYIFHGEIRGLMPRLLLVCALILSAAGCKNWSAATEPLRQLPLPRMKPGSVVLEIAVVEIPPDQNTALAGVWRHVDEQAIPIDVRRRLDQNGFRCGVLGSQLPSVLQEILEGAIPDDETTRQLDSELKELLAHRRTFIEHQRMQMETGETHWVPSADTAEELLWTVVANNQLKSGTIQMGRCGFSLVPRSKGNGSVSLQVTPTIKHGPLRPRYHVSGDSFVYQAESNEIELNELQLKREIRPGQSLIVSPTNELSGLASNFFTGAQHGDKTSRRILLVRVLQTQEDDLFAPRQSHRPLATNSN